MKKLFSSVMYMMAALVMAFTMDSCNKEKNETMNVGENTFFSDDNENYGRDFGEHDLDSLPPIIITSIPTFPCEVLFVINKEYEMAQNNISDKNEYLGIPITEYPKAKYLELRLMDLYPNVAYDGIVDDSQEFYDSINIVYNTYLVSHPQLLDTNDRNCLGSAFVYEDKEDEVLLMSEERLFEFLRLNDEEIALFNAYKELAKMNEFAKLDDIFKVGNKMKQTRFCWANFGCICILALGDISNMYFTAMTCKARTETALDDYYHNDYVEGGRGGAFKHICVSMLLRRYLSAVKAFLIMDVIYEGITNHNEIARDTHMDLHNNMVGRETKYWTFRGSYFGDMYNCDLWISRMYCFVQNTNNGVHKNWQTNQGFWQLALDRILYPCPQKYVYYESIP